MTAKTEPSQSQRSFSPMTQPVAKRKRVPVHGVLLLDKPVGLSSTQALSAAKRLLNAEKAGHTGTLDPFATGLLPLCFGEATKFAQDLLEADKTYEATIHLGISTTTGDTEGEVIDTRAVNVSAEQIQTVLKQFQGPILQVPPMYSALKRDGKPLYEYARAGITLEREARAVTIHQLDLVAFETPYVKIRVRCSKGTYIRVLGEDIGSALGCGAHLSALRRTGLGKLALSTARTLTELESYEESARGDLLLPIDALLSDLPFINLPEELASRFLQGQRLSLAKEGLSPQFFSALCKVYQDERILGVAEITEDGVLQPKKLVSAMAVT